MGQISSTHCLAIKRSERYVKLTNARQMRVRPTQAEAVLWAYLRNNRLLGLSFRRQHLIFGFIVDFYSCQLKLAIEVDGLIHDQQHDYDIERDAILLQRGIKTLRFSNEAVISNPIHVSRQIESIVVEIQQT